MASDAPHVVWLNETGRGDVALVGGKNSSLGEMIRTLVVQGRAGARRLRHDRRRPTGPSSTTTSSARAIAGLLADLEAPEADACRGRFRHPRRLPRMANGRMRPRRRSPRPTANSASVTGRAPLDVAVRSSATAEDLPEASFAGQQETYLNIRGERGAARRLPALLRLALHRPRDLLPPDQGLRPHAGRPLDRRAAHGALRPRRLRRDVLHRHRDRLRQGRPDQRRLGPRRERRPGHRRPRRVPGLQAAPRRSGLDADHREEARRQGEEDDLRDRRERPTIERADLESRARGFVLSDDEILQLAPLGGAPSRSTTAARWTWSGRRTARPATSSSSRRGRRPCSRGARPALLKTYGIIEQGQGARAPASAIGDADRRRPRLPDRGRARHRRASSTARSSSPTMTDPDWVPIMKRAAAIVTDHGGRTSHAAIVSRELGVPAIVGTGNATAGPPRRPGGHGFLRRRRRRATSMKASPSSRCETLDVSQTCRDHATEVMLNLANPAAAFRWWQIPADGVGLARMEFVVSNAHQGPPDGARPLRQPQGRGGQGARSPS